MKIRMILAVLAAFLIFPSISVTAYAGGGDSSEPPPEQQIIDITPRTEAPASADAVTDNTGPELPGETAEPAGESAVQDASDTEGRPFTPAGTGTVLDNTTDADGKEFFTITTASDNTFYLEQINKI